jgi:hypothetical protein
MSEQSSTPATDAGTTTAAGDGVTDEELTAQVGKQTDSDLKVEGTFEREGGGAASDTEAAKATGDELA